MPSSIRNSTYEISIRVPTFLGLYQDGDSLNVDASYAVDAVNVETTGGQLATVARPARLPAELPAHIGTLAYLYRRWVGPTEAQYLLVAASGGKLYWMTPGGSVWTAIPMAEGFDAYATDEWSWVTYEINEYNSDPIDVLLLTNATDGMIMVRGDTLAASVVETPKKFGVISRYAERIWGTAIADDPDILAYSQPFDPTNWTLDYANPINGAGDIQQPTWDGDSFQTLLQLGSQLLAFKKRITFRVLGATPDEYTIKEQYGAGAEFPRTTVVEGARVLMLGREGVMQYDGMDTTPYYPQYARKVYARMNQDALDAACACVYQNRYYCAIPLDGSTVNNAVLVYNTLERTWLLYEGMTVEAFLPTEDALLFTNATKPGLVYRWAGGNTALPMRWVSPWLDFSRLDTVKGPFTVRLTAISEELAGLHVTVETERKARRKRVEFDPDTRTGMARQRRVRFGVTGGRFRFRIEYDERAMLRLPGGIQVDMEVGEDW